MTREIVIDKAVITEEAVFDYESLCEQPLPKTDIKYECENYITNMRIGGKLGRDYYFRCKYYAEASDRMLMLFFYKGQRFGKMQMWELKGICEASDYSDALEESGQIRVWLNSKINPEDTGDWVWDLRVWEEKRQKEREDYND